MTDIAGLAQLLEAAVRDAKAVAQLSETAALSVEEAYAVQAALLERRLRRGERRVGMKMGFTSRAKRLQMGVDEMIWGRLTDAMLVDDGGEIELRRYVHPRVEPEVAFLLGQPLAGRVSMAEALAAVDAVAPAMEIIDSRYRDFKFSLADVIADNSSSAGFVVGPWSDLLDDLSNLGIILELDGRICQIGSSAAILGHPLRSLVAAARLGSTSEERLEAGWIIMAGGATEAVALTPGVHVRTTIQNLGSVSFSVKG